jgi:thiamine pyrophosphokinase
LGAGYGLLIAVDGGGKPLYEFGYQPQLLMGDFDSLALEYKKSLAAGGAEIKSFPAEKDWTDLELAFNYLLTQECQEALVFGALGGRLDHTVANLSLLYQLKQQGIAGVFIGQEQAVTLLKPQERLRINPFPHGHFSLLPYPFVARGVTIRGAKYPLDQAVLELGSTRGVHNEFLSVPVQVSIDSGSALVIVERIQYWPGETELFQRLPS